MGELILVLIITCIVCGGVPLLAFAYMNRKPFINSLPKLKKRTWNMAHEDEADNIPFSFEELVHSSIEIFTKS